MSKEKQIEEMAKNCHFYDDGVCHLCEELLVSCDRKCDLSILVENLYTAGYRKQSEGEWISNHQTDEYICSLCGAIAPVDCLKEDFYKSEFCPNCGAKMKGGAE